MAEMLTDLSLGVHHAILCWLPNKEGYLAVYHVHLCGQWLEGQKAHWQSETIATRLEQDTALPLSECGPTSGCGPDPRKQRMGTSAPSGTFLQARVLAMRRERWALTPLPGCQAVSSHS